MDNEAVTWTRKALDLCKDAGPNLVLFRNDDYNIVVTNATTPEAITALGKALACGYSEESEE